MKVKLMMLENVFVAEGPKGLLERFFEPQDVGVIVRGLLANL